MTKNILTQKDLNRKILFDAKEDFRFRLVRIGVLLIPAIVIAIFTPWYAAVCIGTVFAALLAWSLIMYLQTKRIVENGEITVTQEPLTQITERTYGCYATVSRPEIVFVFQEEHHRARAVDRVLVEMSSVGDMFYLVFADRKHKKVALYYNMKYYEIV